MSRKIIGVTGRIGSGKDEVAKYLIANHKFTKFSFASALKDIVAVVFDWPRHLLEGDTAESRKWREEVDSWWATRLNIPHLTPRWVLQHIGTEVMRDHFHPDIWIASLERKLLRHKGNVVITDCRFFNELGLISQMNGTLIRIERGEIPNWYEVAEKYNKQIPGSVPPAGVHASEYSSVGYDYDYILDNNSNINDLQKMVKQILINS